MTAVPELRFPVWFIAGPEIATTTDTATIRVVGGQIDGRGFAALFTDYSLLDEHCAERSGGLAHDLVPVKVKTPDVLRRALATFLRQGRDHVAFNVTNNDPQLIAIADVLAQLDRGGGVAE
jgi:hypothetical protein